MYQKKEFKFLGVRIVPLRHDRARTCLKVLHENYGSTYALLKNGDVATSNPALFRARPATGGLRLAEALRKLGVLNGAEYAQFCAAEKRREAAQERADWAASILGGSDRLMITLGSKFRKRLERLCSNGVRG